MRLSLKALLQFARKWISFSVISSLTISESSLLADRFGSVSSAALEKSVSFGPSPVKTSQGGALKAFELSGMVPGKNFEGSTGELVILFSDLHAQTEAQLNIARAIKDLVRRRGLSLVFLEGAEGPVQTLLYGAFPDPEVRREVGRVFLERGYLTGPEFAAIDLGADASLKLWGVEDQRLYWENFRLFQEVRQAQDGFKAEFLEIDRWFAGVKDKLYSEPLKALDAIQTDINSSRGSMKEILSRFGSQWEKIFLKHKVPKFLQAKWVRVRSLNDLMAEQENFKDELIQKDLSELMNLLNHKMSEEDLKELLKLTVGYRVGQVGLRQFLQSLKDYYSRSGEAGFEMRFGHIHQYLVFLNRIESADVKESWAESESLIHELKLWLATKQGCRGLVELEDMWKWIQELTRLELGRTDWLTVTGKFSSAAAFQGEWVARTREAGLQASVFMPGNFEHYKRPLELAWDFYEMAVRREREMADRFLKGMEKAAKMKEKTNHIPYEAVLVTGGFHTEGLQKILQERNISYETWVPRVQGSLETGLYERRMRENFGSLGETEFSEKRIAMRRVQGDVRRMLSPPVLLNEILSSLGRELDHVRVEILRQMVARTRRYESLNAVLDAWMVRRENLDIVQSLRWRDFQLLFRALDSQRVFLRLDRLDRINPIEARLAIETVRRVYGEKFPALVRLTNHYFASVLRNGRSGLKGIEVKAPKVILERGVESTVNDLARRFQDVTSAKQEEVVENIIKDFVESKAVVVSEDLLKRMRAFLKVYADLHETQARWGAARENNFVFKKKIKAFRSKNQWKGEWFGSVLFLKMILGHLGNPGASLVVLSEKDLRALAGNIQKSPRHERESFSMVALTHEGTIYVNEESTLGDIWFYIAHEYSHIRGIRERAARKLDVQFIATVKGFVKILRTYMKLKEPKLQSLARDSADQLEMWILDHELDIHFAALGLSEAGRAFLNRYGFQVAVPAKSDESYLRAIAASASGVVRANVDSNVLMAMTEYAETANSLDLNDFTNRSTEELKQKFSGFRKYTDDEIRTMDPAAAAEIVYAELKYRLNVRLLYHLLSKIRQTLRQLTPLQRVRQDVVEPLQKLGRIVGKEMRRDSKRKSEIRSAVKEILNEEAPLYRRANRAVELDLLLSEASFEQYAMELLKPLLDQDPKETIAILRELRNPLSLKSLLGFLDHSNEEVVALAVSAIAKWGRQDAPMTLFKSEGFDVRIVAVLRRYLEKKERTLSERQADIVKDASWIAGNVKMKEAIPWLIGVIAHWRNEEIQSAAALALAVINEPSSVTLISRRLLQGLVGNRKWGFMALGRIDSSGALIRVIDSILEPKSSRDKFWAYQALETLVRRNDFSSGSFDNVAGLIFYDAGNEKVKRNLQRYASGTSMAFISGRVVEAYWREKKLKILSGLSANRAKAFLRRLRSDEDFLKEFVQGLFHCGRLQVAEVEKIAKADGGFLSGAMRIVLKKSGPWLKEIQFLERSEKAFYQGKVVFGDHFWIELGRRVEDFEAEKMAEKYPAGRCWYQRRVLRIVNQSFLDEWQMGDVRRRVALMEEIMRRTIYTDPRASDDPSWSYVDFEDDVIGLHQDFFLSPGGVALGVATAWHEDYHYIRKEYHHLVQEVDEVSLLGAASIDAVEFRLAVSLLEEREIKEIFDEIRNNAVLETMAEDFKGRIKKKMPKGLQDYNMKVLEILRGIELHYEKDGPMQAYAEIRKLPLSDLEGLSWMGILRILRKTWDEEEKVTTLRGEEVIRVDTYRQGPGVSGYALALSRELEWPDAFPIFLNLMVRNQAHPAQAEFIVTLAARLMKWAEQEVFPQIEKKEFESETLNSLYLARKWMRRVYLDYFVRKAAKISRTGVNGAGDEINLWSTYRELKDLISQVEPMVRSEVQSESVQPLLMKLVWQGLALKAQIYKAERVLSILGLIVASGGGSIPLCQTAPIPEIEVPALPGPMSQGPSISNREVGEVLQKILDKSGLKPDEVRLEGAVLSFTPQDIRGRNDQSLLGRLSTFLEGKNYLALNAKERQVLDECRWVLLPGRVSVAESEHATSYAHYEEAVRPTLFLGQRLVEYLLEQDPQSLALLIRIELNRRLYKRRNGEDNRPTERVVKDTGVTAEEFNRLQKSIAKAEAAFFFERYSTRNVDMAELVIRARKWIESREAKEMMLAELRMDGLKEYAVDALIESLAEKMKARDAALEKGLHREMQAEQKPSVNRTLKESLKTLFEGGAFSESDLGGISFEKILADPKAFLFPQVGTNRQNDVESYPETKKIVESMA